MKTSMRSPLATCLLIRYTADLLKGDIDASAARAAYEFLEGCMRHKSEMVIYEAAKAVCDLPGVVAKYVHLVFSVWMMEQWPAVAGENVDVPTPTCCARDGADFALGITALSHTWLVSLFLKTA